MDSNLIKAQDVVLEKINQICGKFGLNNIMAQLYAILYLNAKPMSLNEMLERLKISKGSVSVNIRALERYGVVRQGWGKGSRKDYYEAEMDISSVIAERIDSMVKKRFTDVNDMINSSYEALDSVVPQGPDEIREIEIFKQRLDKLKNLRDKVSSLFVLLNSNFLKSMLNSEDAGTEQLALKDVVVPKTQNI